MTNTLHKQKKVKSLSKGCCVFKASRKERGEKEVEHSASMLGTGKNTTRIQKPEREPFMVRVDPFPISLAQALV